MASARPTPQAIDGVPWESALGERLRELRRERGLSLAAVAQATRISTSFLSLLENGQTDVTMGRLLLLVNFYGLSVAELMSDNGGPGTVVVRADEARYLFSVAKGMDVFLAAPDSRRPFLPMVGIYKPGARMRKHSVHEGDEFLFVISGSIRLEIEGREASVLREGDTAFFSAQRPHRLSTEGDTEARVLTITTERLPV